MKCPVENCSNELVHVGNFWVCPVHGTQEIQIKVEQEPELSFRAEFINKLPYPIAKPYSLAVDKTQGRIFRYNALVFTYYQLLRIISLPQISSYLLSESPDVKTLDHALGGLRTPYISSWHHWLDTVIKEFPHHNIKIVYSGLKDKIQELKKKDVKEKVLPFLKVKLESVSLFDCIQHLRNNIAHGGMIIPEQADEAVRIFLPLLEELLSQLDFLMGTYIFWKSPDGVMLLRGSTVKEAKSIPAGVASQFDISSLVLVFENDVIPLFPFFIEIVDSKDLIFLYDGHTKDKINYLGISERREEHGKALEKLTELLEKKQISFELKKRDLSTWKLLEQAIESTKVRLGSLTGVKYFPDFYLERDVDRHVWSFISGLPQNVPDRYVSGMLLVGDFGCGKTSLLCRIADKHINVEQPEDKDITLFLSGCDLRMGIGTDPHIILFTSICKALGISYGENGVTNFKELLSTLKARKKQDKNPDRKFLIIIDGINEADFAVEVFSEALQMIEIAGYYDWVKIIVGVRENFFNIYLEKSKQFRSGWDVLEHYSPYLVISIEKVRDEEKIKPYMRVPLLKLEEAKTLYNRRLESYETKTHLDHWSRVPVPIRHLIIRPLFMELFIRLFMQSGRMPNVVSQEQLMAAYIDNLVGRSGKELIKTLFLITDEMEKSGRPVISEEFYDDFKQSWENKHPVPVAHSLLNPMEVLVNDSLIIRTADGFRFSHQTIGEYAFYLKWTNEGLSSLNLKEYADKALQLNLDEYYGAFYYLFNSFILEKKYQKISELFQNDNPKITDELSHNLLEGLCVFLGEKASKKKNLGNTALGKTVIYLTARFPEKSITFFNEKIWTTLYEKSYFGSAAWLMETIIEVIEESKKVKDEEISKTIFQTLRNYGHSLTCLMLNDKALAQYNRANELASNLGKDFYYELALILLLRARAFCELGDNTKAQEDCEKALKLIQKVEVKKDTEILNNLARAHQTLGIILCESGNVIKALPEFKIAVKIREDLVKKGHVKFKKLLATSQYNLGIALYESGKLNEALEHFNQAIGVIEELVDAGNWEQAKELAWLYSHSADVLVELRRVEESISLCRKATNYLEELIRLGRKELNHDLAINRINFGKRLAEHGNLTEALSEIEKGTADLKLLIDNNHPEFLCDLAWGESIHGEIWAKSGKNKEALSCYNQAISIYKELILKGQKQYEEEMNRACRLRDIR